MRRAEWIPPILLILVVVSIIGSLLFDEVQEWRAFDAIADCRAAHGSPLRQGFTTKVRCAPLPLRNDTTTVNLHTGG